MNHCDFLRNDVLIVKQGKKYPREVLKVSLICNADLESLSGCVGALNGGISLGTETNS